MRFVYTLLSVAATVVAICLLAGGAHDSANEMAHILNYDGVFRLVHQEEIRDCHWLVALLPAALFAGLAWREIQRDMAEKLRAARQPVPPLYRPVPATFAVYFAGLAVVGLATLMCVGHVFAATPAGSAVETVTFNQERVIAGWYLLAGIPTTYFTFWGMMRTLSEAAE